MLRDVLVPSVWSFTATLLPLEVVRPVLGPTVVYSLSGPLGIARGGSKTVRTVRVYSTPSVAEQS